MVLLIALVSCFSWGRVPVAGKNDSMERKTLAVGIFTLILLAVLSAGCSGWVGVAIKDAYCDFNGNFEFTIQNPGDEEVFLDYRWTLNDPMADTPLHEGEGTVTLQGLEAKTLSFSVPSGLHGYDPRFYVMHVYLYSDGKMIREYREQKSPYDWNYSVLPPVKFKQKPDEVYIAFETFVSKNEEDDLIVRIENVSYVPYEGQIKLKLSEFYITIDGKNGGGWFTSELLAPSVLEDSCPLFYDADANSIVSDFDYYVIPSELLNNSETMVIEFGTACPFVYKGWDRRGELLKEEDRAAIVIKDISTNPENPATLECLEFIIKVQSLYGIGITDLKIVACNGRGMGSMGTHLNLISQEGQNYTYSGKFEKDLIEDESVPKYAYIELRDNDVNERLVLYKLKL